MKIVWLCMFINQEFKDYFNRPDLTNWAVWIPHLYDLIKDIPDLELHIVAPNLYTNSTEIVNKSDITFHFFRTDHDVLKLTQLNATNPLNLNKINEEVSQIIKTINPDLIHLHGTENLNYTSPALMVYKKFPSVMTVQRFNFMATGWTFRYDLVVKFEEMVLRQFRYFGIRTLEMQQIISRRNPNAKQYFHNYPVAHPITVKSGEESEDHFDAVFFARITRDKGIFDLIEATKLILKQRPTYEVHLLGMLKEDEEAEIREAVLRAGLESVLLFKGNEQDQNTLHQYVCNARICVLPTHADIVPGTIIESMLMKLPVVSYAVGGMPQLNEPGHERIKLVTKGDINALAQAQLDLLENVQKCNEMADEAYKFAKNYYSNEKIVHDIKTMYEKIINNETH